MSERTSRYVDVVARVLPSRSEAVSRRPTGPRDASQGLRAYDVLIYSDQQIPGLAPPVTPPSDRPEQLAGLPLRAVETLALSWDRHQAYLADFDAGDKVPSHMGARLREVMSPGLQALLSGAWAGDRPLRLWWSVGAPELEDLPWELVSPPGRAFVRGLPPRTLPPMVPVEGALRLALIANPDLTPRALLEELGKLDELPGIRFEHLTEPPREALRRAVGSGHELMHIVADGVVSLSYEGALYFSGRSYRGEGEPQMSSGELSSFLSGSRVTVLGLTAADYTAGGGAGERTQPDVIQIAGRVVPSAYRAFAQLGSEELPLPNVVAPLGPIAGPRLAGFWRSFYAGLAETHRIEEAVARGQASGPPVPMALFLRHPQGRLFGHRTARRRRPEAAPNQMQVELQVSRALVERLHTLARQYGELPPSAAEFLEKADRRASELSEDLEDWRQPAEGEE